MQAPEDKLNGMLKAAGLPKRASYRPGEVCEILGISERTFWRMTEAFEPGPDGCPVNVNSLDSYLLHSHRRVRYDALVDFLARNNTYHRRNAEDPRQLLLFEI